MSENCRSYCPVYTECQSRITAIASAQRELRVNQNVLGGAYRNLEVSPNIVPVAVATYEDDPNAIYKPVTESRDLLQDAVEGELAISHAARYCSGPRMKAIGHFLIGLNHLTNSFTFGINRHHSLEFEAALRVVYPKCSSKDAVAGLDRIPVVLNSRSAA